MQFECKKHGLSQQQSGEWTLAVKVHANDVPSALLTAPMGTRYQAVIVEIDDQEQPVEHPKPDKKDDPHRLSRQAAMLCDDLVFRNFLRSIARLTWEHYKDELTTDQTAAECVRKLCKVQSRSEFDTDKEAAARWRDLHGKYQEWRMCVD